MKSIVHADKPKMIDALDENIRRVIAVINQWSKTGLIFEK